MERPGPFMESFFVTHTVCIGSVCTYTGSGRTDKQCVRVRRVRTGSVCEASSYVQAACGSTSCTYRQCVRGEYVQVVCGSL